MKIVFSFQVGHCRWRPQSATSVPPSHSKAMLRPSALRQTIVVTLSVAYIREKVQRTTDEQSVTSVNASSGTVSAFCNVLDHQACDELCKVDNFWYGYCIAWDGKDFSCKCFEYHPPLDGKKCEGRQEHCSKKCLQGGSEGGFCYPQKDIEGRTNRTGCECFKELPPLLRRKKRGAGYKRQVVSSSTLIV